MWTDKRPRLRHTHHSPAPAGHHRADVNQARLDYSPDFTGCFWGIGVLRSAAVCGFGLSTWTASLCEKSNAKPKKNPKIPQH
ncbi:hypothetical protein UPYG_G00035300 [Umbra pygmaea]|uniref:Uncharacterized protein n=1 Tax=Umbra pygmaea TaxID=75934 RepID=A0ABD0XNQ8_UMBPY